MCTPADVGSLLCLPSHICLPWPYWFISSSPFQTLRFCTPHFSLDTSSFPWFSLSPPLHTRFPPLPVLSFLWLDFVHPSPLHWYSVSIVESWHWISMLFSSRRQVAVGLGLEVATSKHGFSLRTVAFSELCCTCDLYVTMNSRSNEKTNHSADALVV